MTQKSPRFAYSAEQLKVICKIITYFIISISLSFYFILFCIFIWIELTRKVIIIDTFEVPNKLQEKGYTSQVLVNKLNDEINKIKEIANTPIVQESIDNLEYFRKAYLISPISQKYPVIEKQKEINIKIQGIDFPLGFFLQYIRAHIACEVTLLGNRNQLKLTTRVQGSPAKIHYGSLANLDSILHKAAKYIYEHADPYSLASYLYANNQIKDSINVIQQYPLLDRKKELHLTYNLWGMALLRQEKYDEAIDKFKKSKEIKPWFAQTYNSWGLVLYAQGRYKEAIEKYQEAHEIDPYSALIYNNWGLALYNLEKYDEAIEKYQNAINLDPQFAYTYVNLGTVFYHQRKYDDAIEEYKIAIDINPKLVAAYFSWGLALHDQAKYDEAIEKYKKAIDTDPSFVPAYHYWGVALNSKGENSEAIKKFEKVLEINPQYARTYETWGEILYAQGKYNDASNKIEKAVELNPSAPMYSNLGIILFIQKNYNAAVKNFEKAVELDRQYFLAHYNWGLLLYEQRKYKEAIEKFKEVIGINPNFAPAYYNWGLVLQDQGKDKYDEAIEKYEKALEIDPLFAPAYLYLGIILYSHEDYEGAMRKYEKAAEIDPQYAPVYQYWGIALSDQREYEKAEEKFKKLMVIDPRYLSYPEVHYNLGVTLYRRGKLIDAIKEFDKAINLDENYFLAYYNWGLALQDQGKDKYGEAIDKYKKSIEINLQFAPAHHYLGKIYLAMGQKYEAVNSFQQVLNFAPGTELADEANKLIIQANAK